jgi:regulation of enolase protein 1 (concanavalin A-like superfamily)
MTPSNGMAYQYRTSTGGSTSNSNTAALTAPYWVRLVKTGDLISAFRSADGITWTQEGTAQTITMPSQYFIGFTLCSNTSSGTASVTFDNLTVTSTAANKAPRVAVGADQSVTSLIANLTSVTSDDNLPNLPANVSYTWQQLSGPGTATFATPNAAQSEVLFSTEGTYALRLLADDGFVKTYDDLNVSATSQTVTLTATDSIISETGSNPASCTFNRLTNLGDLTVNYTITGTATAADYATLTGSIIIPDGQTSATLSILPINDTLLEGPETLEITINSGGYLIGSPDTVNFTIEDDDSPPIVNITSPTASTVAIPAAVGIILSAEVNDDGTPTPALLTQEWTKVSGPGTVTFETPNLPATAALFSASGTYVLRLTASDGQQSTSDDVTVHVNVPTVFSPTWQDLGSTNPPSTQSFNATTGTYTVSVGGRAFSTQTNDVGSFGAMPFVGDFEMIAKVTCNDAQGSTSERVGLVIRQGTASGTAQAFIGTSFTNYIWATRTTNGGAGTVTQNPWSTGDRWVRLVRSGSAITGFSSTNGTTWTQSGTINLTLSNPIYVGIGAASGSVNNAVNGTVSNISFISSSANVGALVNAGSDQTIQLPQSATLVGSSSDDGLPSNPGTHTLTWSKVSGPGSVEFSHLSSATTSATFSAVGTYSLRLIAHDSEVQTFDDILVTTTATPFQAWRNEHFSTIANPQDAANLADPDNDSIPNLLEYAFGTDPTIANVNGGPTTETIELNGEKYLQLNITKNPNATDLIYQVEFSTDMVHWSSEGNVIITNTPTLLEVRSPAKSIKKYGRAVITNP